MMITMAARTSGSVAVESIEESGILMVF